ncbi:MAG TPA: nitronate monooxygenase [Candidatus Binatia bacterium]|nr:nitronate monooxygenase [Candidatus Binatia bacterium]
MIRSPICEMFGTAYPIWLAGMGGVSMAPLVAAISNAGGLGVIGAATLSPEGLRREIRKTRELTDKPFAVDLLAPIPDMIRPHMQVVFEETIEVFVAGLAVPREFIAEMHSRGMKVVVMTGKVSHALRAEEAGADAVVAQGTEAGGHTGEIGALALVPQVVDAVKIPVLAAGGIVDGRGLVAALALGAQGVVIGTRFIASEEATAAPSYQQAIVRAGDDSTVRTRCYTGKPARTIRNPYVAELEREPSKIRSFPHQAVYSSQQGVMDYVGRGGGCDPQRTFMPAGQGSGAIHDVRPAAEIFRSIVEEAERIVEEKFRSVGSSKRGAAAPARA